jgi:hypothetical protein
MIRQSSGIYPSTQLTARGFRSGICQRLKCMIEFTRLSSFSYTNKPCTSTVCTALLIATPEISFLWCIFLKNLCIVSPNVVLSAWESNSPTDYTEFYSHADNTTLGETMQRFLRNMYQRSEISGVRMQ